MPAQLVVKFVRAVQFAFNVSPNIIWFQMAANLARLDALDAPFLQVIPAQLAPAATILILQIVLNALCLVIIV